MVQHCLVEWVNEKRWDVWKTNKLPQEYRYEGAIGMFPWTDGKEYLGKVLKISANLKAIEKAEAELAKKMGAPVVAGSKRKITATSRQGQASDNEIAKILGERKKLDNDQAAAKKQTQAAKAQKAKAVSQVIASEDDDLLSSLNVKRSLNFDMNTSKTQGGVELLSDEEVDDDEEFDEDLNNELQPYDQINVLNTNNETSSDDECVEDVSAGPTLDSFKNPNTEAFLRHLLKVFSPPPEESSSSFIKEYAEPLERPGQKMVPLKKHHSLTIAKGSKAKLLVDFKSRKSASNFLRKTLFELYGHNQLARMTAKGRLKDSLGISSADLNAIWAFISEYTKNTMTWDSFIATINKKCSSYKSPKSPKSGQTTPTKSASKKKKTLTAESDAESCPSPSKRKKSEADEEQSVKINVIVTPKKLARSIIASPLKMLNEGGLTCRESSATQRPVEGHASQTQENGYVPNGHLQPSIQQQENRSIPNSEALRQESKASQRYPESSCGSQQHPQQHPQHPGIPFNAQQDNRFMYQNSYYNSYQQYPHQYYPENFNSGSEPSSSWGAPAPNQWGHMEWRQHEKNRLNLLDL